MKTSLATIVILIASASVLAQEVKDELQNVTIHLGTQFGLPANSFRKNVGNATGFGGNFSVVWNPSRKIPEIGVGASLSYMHFGRDLNTTFDELKIKTAHSIFPLHGIIRYQPVTTNRIRPYFDFLIGMNIFQTRTKEREHFLVTIFEKDSEPIVIDKFNHTAFSWGGALGIMVDLGEKRRSALGIKVIAIKGDTTDYSRKGTTNVINENIEYTFFRSKTDMYLAQLNFVVYF